MTRPERMFELNRVLNIGAYRCTKSGMLYSHANDGPFAGKRHKKSARPAKNGYLLVSIRLPAVTKWFALHQVVWVYFNGPYDGSKFQVNHKNGNKIDNRLCNLELVTAGRNISHAHAIGLINQRGSRNPLAVLNEDIVVRMRLLNSLGFQKKYIARVFGVGHGTAALAIRGKTWTHVA